MAIISIITGFCSLFFGAYLLPRFSGVGYIFLCIVGPALIGASVYALTWPEQGGE